MKNAEPLFSALREKLLSFADSILRNREDAQDVVQEVFQSCLEMKATTIDRPYLFKAVRNRSINKIRAQRRYRSAMDRLASVLI